MVGLFYSAIVPTGLFITAGAMTMLYWVDKYSLLRLWKRPPVSPSRSGDIFCRCRLARVLLSCTIAAVLERCLACVAAAMRSEVTYIEVHCDPG